MMKIAMINEQPRNPIPTCASFIHQQTFQLSFSSLTNYRTFCRVPPYLQRKTLTLNFEKTEAAEGVVTGHWSVNGGACTTLLGYLVNLTFF